MKNPDDTAKLIKKMDKMIKIKKNNILMIPCQHGKILRRFKTDNKFISAASAFKISKTTRNFKIDIVKFIAKYAKYAKRSYLSYSNLVKKRSPEILRYLNSNSTSHIFLQVGKILKQ